LWGGVAGLAGLVGLMGLYRAMAIGPMSIAAPVTAVLSASAPVVVGALTQGFPGPRRLLGFALALAGIWLLARPVSATRRPAGLGLAVVAGLGFGGFLVCIAQVQAPAVFWPLVAARSAGIALLAILALTGRPVRRLAPGACLPIGLAGLMDAAGNALFVLAERAGRLDVAGVLASLYPATTVLLALLILRERPRRPQGAGMLLALIAVPLIAG
jgi:drug/metabolite transporter (DMT)-like permease